MNDRFGFGTAVYHPFIDIEDSTWLRNALLFWEDIRTIVPSSIEKPYRCRDTQLLSAEGILSPIAPDRHPEALSRIQELILKLADSDHARDELGLRLGRAVTPENPWLMHAGKVGDRLRRELGGRLHRDKLPGKLRKLLRRLPEDEGFLGVDPRFASAYMSVLATELARESGGSPVTNVETSFGTSLRASVAQAAAEGPDAPADGLLVSIAMEHLVIDPTVPVDQLLRFKRGHAAELEQLAAEFDTLAVAIQKAEPARELRLEAERVYRKQVRPALERLQTRLERNFIGCAFGGIALAATLATAASVSTAGVVPLAGTALLTLSSFALNARFAHGNARLDSSFTYLSDLHRNFSLPKRLLED